MNSSKLSSIDWLIERLLSFIFDMSISFIFVMCLNAPENIITSAAHIPATTLTEYISRLSCLRFSRVFSLAAAARISSLMPAGGSTAAISSVKQAIRSAHSSHSAMCSMTFAFSLSLKPPRSRSVNFLSSVCVIAV